jgi:aconitase A
MRCERAVRARAAFDLSSVVRNMAGPSNPHKRLPPRLAERGIARQVGKKRRA